MVPPIWSAIIARGAAWARGPSVRAGYTASHDLAEDPPSNSAHRAQGAALLALRPIARGHCRCALLCGRAPHRACAGTALRSTPLDQRPAIMVESRVRGNGFDEWVDADFAWLTT